VVAPCESLDSTVRLIRLRAELALLVMLDHGFGYADPRLPAETYLRDDDARERLFRAGLKPKGTHTDSARAVAERIAELEPLSYGDLEALGRRLALAPSELAVLAIVVAYELDRDVQSLCHALAGRRTPRLYADHCLELGHPEIGSAAELAAALSPASPLRFVVHCDERPHGALSLGDDARQWLTGDGRLPPSLRPLLHPLASADALEHDATTTARLDAVAAAVAGTRTLVVLQGPQGSGKQSFAAHLGERVAVPVIATSVPTLERGGDPWLSLRRALVHARIHGHALYLAGLETLGDRTRVAQLLALVDDGPDLVILGTRRPGLVQLGDRAFHHVQLHRPDLKGRTIVWQREIERVGASMPADDLARRFVVGPSDIRAACESASSFAALTGRTVTHEDIETALARQLSLDLGSFATRIQRRALWTEMVLPDDVQETLHDMVTMVRERSQILEDWGYARHLGLSRGVAALFSGAPGTGKTMAASVISGELGLELFRIDLSQVVSKWVGETEKHLARIFDEAQNAHAMLLFDEADSLFGKRTEVKSASDRYANLEVNYILQRMEQFDGVSILTTNLETALDTAFMRRLNFRVRFPEPDAEERQKLWQTLLPPETGLSSTPELAELASRFEMTGGHIRNAIVRAAVVAAREGRKMSAGDLETGALSEYYELGKVMSASPFARRD